IDILVEKIEDEQFEKVAKDLERAFGMYVLDGDGAHVWIVPDGYMAALTDHEKRWEKQGGGYFSHEALCVQNTGARDTRCELFISRRRAGRSCGTPSRWKRAVRSICAWTRSRARPASRLSRRARRWDTRS